jgi:predicted transglutaminase-like cysteine proteinase
LHSVLAAAALSGAAPALAAPPAEPAAGPASRWTLPPAHVAMRSAMLGGSSAMEQTLVAQRSIERPAPEARTQLATQYSPWRTGYEPAADTPNVFGSVALAVSRTPLDAQWNRVNASPRPAAWTSGFAHLNAGNRETLLRQVNQWVNGRIRFVDDRRGFGQVDRWSGASETLRRGTGDCEDYALTKMQLLAALGFDGRDMYHTIVRDVVRQGDHAILVVRLDDRFVVLDNLHEDIVDSGALPDYRPIMSYSSAGRWIHGFATEPQRPMQVASYSPAEISGAGAAP